MMIDVGLRMLLHARGKLVLTLFGVAFAVTLVFVQVGLFQGLLANATMTIDKSDAEIWITSKNVPNIDFPHYFPDTLVGRIRTVPGVARADNLFVAYTAMQLPSGAEETVIVYGLDEPELWNLPWTTIEGSARALRTGRTFFLDDSATRRFGAFAVGDYRELFGHRLEVVGRTRGAVSFTTMPLAFTSLRTGQDLQDMFAGRTAYILVKIAPGSDARAVAAEIRTRLPFNDVYTRQDWSDRTRSYWVVSTGLGLNMALTVLLGVLVGVTVVAQTLYAAAIDNTREFGTMKAIGATNAQICTLVVFQAALQGILGFVLAVPVVLGLRHAAAGLGLDVRVSFDFGVLVFAGSLFLCVASSLLTFRRIVSIDPALVFRT